MSELKVDTIVNLAGTGKPNLPVSPTLGGAAISAANTYSYTSSATEPSSPKNGAIWWDSANSKVMVYINGEFKNIELNGTYSSASNYGDRGFSIGDDGATAEERIQYFNLTSASNAADFGDLTVGAAEVAATSNGTTAFRMGGHDGANSNVKQNVIESWTTSTLGNSTDHGDLSAACNYCHGDSDAITGICVLGYIGSYTDAIDRFTMASAGNATDHGNLTYARAYGGSSASVASARMINWAGYGSGGTGGYHDDNDYITITTAGNAVDFGDLIEANHYCTGVGTGSGDRALQLGGKENTGSGGYYTDRIQYNDLSTLGNATDAGNLLTTNGEHAAGMNTATHGFKAGGEASSVYNTIQRTDLATGGNATDWGDLLVATHDNAGTSGSPS